jgi:hypothetical protein
LPSPDGTPPDIASVAAVPDWRDLTRLRAGTPRQRHAAQVLDGLCLIGELRPHDPVLAGTIPLDIDVPDSDLDVICHAPDLDAFAADLQRRFATFPGFTISQHPVRSGPAVVARLAHAGERIEIFAQPHPIDQQDAFRHMVVEWRLLQIGGAKMKARVRGMKAGGMATEPAFAQLLALAGDPYLAMLDLAATSDAELRASLDLME